MTVERLAVLLLRVLTDPTRLPFPSAVQKRCVWCSRFVRWGTGDDATVVECEARCEPL